LTEPPPACPPEKKAGKWTARIGPVAVTGIGGGAAVILTVAVVYAYASGVSLSSILAPDPKTRPVTQRDLDSVVGKLDSRIRALEAADLNHANEYREDRREMARTLEEVKDKLGDLRTDMRILMSRRGRLPQDAAVTGTP